jgi:hypothetical protein
MEWVSCITGKPGNCGDRYHQLESNNASGYGVEMVDQAGNLVPMDRKYRGASAVFKV